jgi:hypothetical protein
LLRRVTYEGFAAAWPGMEEATGDYGKRLNNMPKVVVSTTLTEPAWNNTTVISGNVAAEVAKLAERTAGDLDRPDTLGPALDGASGPAASALAGRVTQLRP